MPQFLPSHRAGTDSIRLGTMITPLPRSDHGTLPQRRAPLTDSAVAGCSSPSGSAPSIRAGRHSRPTKDAGHGSRRWTKGWPCAPGSWRDNPSPTRGRTNTVTTTGFMLPAPSVQQPYPPEWVAGAAKVGAARQPSLERATRWQGWLPLVVDSDWCDRPQSPEELSGLTNQVRRMRGRRTVRGAVRHLLRPRVLRCGPGERDLEAWAETRATRWVEGAWSLEDSQSGRAELQARIQARSSGYQR